MANIFLIHGSYGSPGENWFPWMKRELEKRGNEVYVPTFPTPAGQTLQAWLYVFALYREFLKKDSIIVGHSVGCAFILSVLEGLNFSIKAGFFVSPFLGFLSNMEFDKVNKTFVTRDFNWNNIKKNCQDFHFYHSDDDPYVDVSKAREFTRKLYMDVEIIKGGGHFNADAGYTRFERLRDDILACIDS